MTNEKIIYGIETKELIKRVLESAGVKVPDNATFRDYVDLLKGVATGGSIVVDGYTEEQIKAEVDRILNGEY